MVNASSYRLAVTDSSAVCAVLWCGSIKVLMKETSLSVLDDLSRTIYVIVTRSLVETASFAL